MKKRIFAVAFAAAFLFSGALLVQVENVQAQDAAHADAQANDELGKWIPLYGGGQDPYIEKCYADPKNECLVGDTRKPRAVVAGPAQPVNN